MNKTTSAQTTSLASSLIFSTIIGICAIILPNAACGSSSKAAITTTTHQATSSISNLASDTNSFSNADSTLGSATSSSYSSTSSNSVLGSKNTPTNPAFTLEIMHVNDLHSYLEPTPITFTTDAGRVTAKTGGVSALSHLIAKHRQDNPNLLMISAGDQITGNASNYDLFKGESDAIALKHFQADYYTLGNHEFDDGSTGMTTYSTFVKKFSPQTALVISNVDVGDTDPIKPFINKNIIKTILGHKIAVLGITNPQKIYQSSKPAPDVVIKDTVATVNALTATMTTNGDADIFVLITHEGIALDRINASAFNDVDIIIGGDSHSLCGDFKEVGLKPECRYPMTLKNGNGNKLCVVQAYEHAKLIGDLLIDLDNNGQVVSCRGLPLMPVYTNSAEFKDKTTKQQPSKPKQEQIPQSLANNNSIDSINKAASHESLGYSKNEAVNALKKLVATTPELVEAVNDPILDSELAPYLQKIHDKFNSSLGFSKEDLCSTRLPNEPCEIKNKPAPLGSETCQVFGQVYLEELGGDIYIGNSGGVRADIARGELTLDSLLKSIPFNNKLLMVDLTGNELVELLNQVYRYVLREPISRSGSVPCGYGLIYTLNLAASSTEPISNVATFSVKGSNAEASEAITTATEKDTAKINAQKIATKQGKDKTKANAKDTEKNTLVPNDTTSNASNASNASNTQGTANIQNTDNLTRAILNNYKLDKLDPNRTYHIITNDYVLKGKEGYSLLKKKTGKPLNVTDVEVVSSYLQKAGSLPLLKPELFMMHQIIDGQE